MPLRVEDLAAEERVSAQGFTAVLARNLSTALGLSQTLVRRAICIRYRPSCLAEAWSILSFRS